MMRRPPIPTRTDTRCPYTTLCRPYRLRGKILNYFPAHSADQAEVEPIYEEMDGWHESTAGARSYADLHAQAIKYIQRVQELIETPIALVSTSPERQDPIRSEERRVGKECVRTCS